MNWEREKKTQSVQGKAVTSDRLLFGHFCAVNILYKGTWLNLGDRKQAKTLKLTELETQSAVPFIFSLFIFYSVMTLSTEHLLCTNIMTRESNLRESFLHVNVQVGVRGEPNCVALNGKLSGEKRTGSWDELQQFLLEKTENNHFSEATLVSGLYRPWPCISNLLCSLLVGITVKKEVANAFVKRQKRFDMYEW